MDLAWTPEQLDLHARLREGGAAASDWQTLADLRVMALAAPGEHGGLGQSALNCALALDGLGYGCRDIGLLIAAGAHMWAVGLPLARFGTPEQKAACLPGLSAGRLVGAHAITEAESGSDALALRTVARRKGTTYVLTGRKRFITNAPEADLFLVYANLDSRLGFTGVTTFLVERGQPGVRVEAEQRKMGLNSCHWGQVVLDECVVPEHMRLGAEKQGPAIFSTVMAWERTLLLAPLLGAMERQLEECADRARTRRQFGKRIGSFQSVANRIVDMRLRLETSRGLLRSAAWELDHGPTDGGRQTLSPLPELVKLQVSEAAVATFEDAMQIFGGQGYTQEAGIEERLRDALGTRISSGTSDMQRDVVAAKLGVR
ncbi:acyl-CoA dehydrogenase family protein [Streptomyces sp. NPDC101151]|uniref:acyl-CoA dehydrogenase family protein n=1 Tax=Streptomyces sp. NPDC101151 TaxID=3366115 RepID=UPI00381860BC